MVVYNRIHLPRYQHMKFNNKKLEKTSKLINYTIAIVLCGFLISLSGKLLDDVDEWKERPTVESFEDETLLAARYAEIAAVNTKINLKVEKKTTIENTIKVVNNNYTNAKKSFDNWLEARKTVGSPKEDKAVLSRANALDAFYKTQQEWEKELAEIEHEIQVLNQSKSKINALISKEKGRAYDALDSAIRAYDLKVFLIRLVFILPILILGIFFIIRYRKHKYWPLFLGFVLFSFYAFFLGLVPYLPSYGGYIKYSVGILLCILLGGYAINKIRAFIEHKKQELQVPTTERAKKVQLETAEKALDNHMCPSCGKDFIVKTWDKTVSKSSKTAPTGTVTNFCRFCGLELFKSCNSCGSKNFAHLPFCSHCGDKLNEDNT